MMADRDVEACNDKAWSDNNTVVEVRTAVKDSETYDIGTVAMTGAAATTSTKGRTNTMLNAEAEAEKPYRHDFICSITILPYFMGFLFLAFSFIYRHEAATLWHLLFGGFFIGWVMEMLGVAAFVVCIPKKSRHTFATMSVMQIYGYICCFVLLLIGARLQHSYHYFK